MTFSRRLIIALSILPVMAGAAAVAAQPKEKRCEGGCPFWSIEEMENFFNRPFPKAGGMYASSNMKESDKAYFISIDLPGMDKKDISLETSGNRLIISGERKDESDSKGISKRSYRQFSQSFTLPDDADLDAITATSTNGVLKITVPKSGKKASKKIEIH